MVSAIDRNIYIRNKKTLIIFYSVKNIILFNVDLKMFIISNLYLFTIYYIKVLTN
jgi:hypothetical protein